MPYYEAEIRFYKKKLIFGKKMAKNILGISTSPRRNGNSDLLLKKAIAGAESTGANIEYLSLNDYKINPCIECNACYKKGRCVVKDDYQMILGKLLKADSLIFATPVFFMSVCAQAKMLIDRGQCLWAEKYILGTAERPPQRPTDQSSQPSNDDRRAMVIAVGGSRSIKQFECIRWTFKTYLDGFGVKYVSGLFVGKVDEFGAIKKHPTAFNEAYRLGAILASTDTPLPEKPVNVEIIND
jgi:multimeric flavodoxin WrbA